jgi:thioredoxin-dependent peroxiredoxin
MHCRKQLGELQKSLEGFRARHASVVAISVDSAERNRKLAERFELTYPLLADPDRAVIKGYGVDDAQNEIAWPAVFIIAKDGRVAWRALSETYLYRDRPLASALLDVIAGL